MCFFHVCPQITCQRWCIVTLVAFVWLFPTVHFQMSPQMACMRGCIITLVALVRLFSTVCFHMSPQMAFVGGLIIALVAFVKLYDIFSTFHGDFHILFAQCMISKSFFHFHSQHSIVLLSKAASWYWGKPEVQEDIRSACKRESENDFKSNILNIKCSAQC